MNLSSNLWKWFFIAIYNMKKLPYNNSQCQNNMTNGTECINFYGGIIACLEHFIFIENINQCKMSCDLKMCINLIVFRFSQNSLFMYSFIIQIIVNSILFYQYCSKYLILELIFILVWINKYFFNFLFFKKNMSNVDSRIFCILFICFKTIQNYYFDKFLR